MNSSGLPWEVCKLSEESLVLQVAEADELVSFAECLLGSKAAMRRVLAREQLLRAGQVLRRGDWLSCGDLLTLRFWLPQKGGQAGEVQPAGSESRPTTNGTRPSTNTPRLAGSELQVVYRDRLLLAVDKPAGLLVHADGTGADTLTARVQTLLAHEGIPAIVQAVQRLDVETTGLVLFSLTEEFQPMLDAQVAGHDMGKRYLAIVEGRMGVPGTTRELTWPIARNRHDARRMRVGRTGKPSCTHVRVLAVAKGRTLIEAELQTGRRHQIRVHLAHSGHPLCGDKLYGGHACAEGLMLHAWQEHLVHPLTGETIELSAPPPERFTRLWGGALPVAQ